MYLQHLVKLECSSRTCYHWVVTKKRNSYYLSHLNCSPEFARFKSN